MMSIGTVIVGALTIWTPIARAAEATLAVARWRAVMHWSVRTIRAAGFTVVSPAASAIRKSSRTLGTTGFATATISRTAIATVWTAITRAAEATLAAWSASSVRPASVWSLGGKLFANCHAKFHQLIAIERAVFVVIEQLEQLLLYFRIMSVARRRVDVFAWIAGLRQRRQR
jgi:hypothetical protein